MTLTQQNFEQFYRLVLEEISLQKELRDISDKEDFFARVIELGKENGFDFTVENIREKNQQNQRAWIERWI